MTDQSTTTISVENHPLPLRLAVDRTRAMVRGLWRCVCGALLIGLILAIDLDWRLLWQAQKASFLAFGLLTALVAVAGLGLLTYGARWLLLAAWPSRMGVEVSPMQLTMRAGPFGTETYAWREIRVAYDEEVDHALWDVLLDDETLPRVRHPSCHEDLVVRIQRLSALQTAELAALLKPYLKRGLAASSTDGTRPTNA